MQCLEYSAHITEEVILIVGLQGVTYTASQGPRCIVDPGNPVARRPQQIGKNKSRERMMISERRESQPGNLGIVASPIQLPETDISRPLLGPDDELPIPGQLVCSDSQALLRGQIKAIPIQRHGTDYGIGDFDDVHAGHSIGGKQ